MIENHMESKTMENNGKSYGKWWEIIWNSKFRKGSVQSHLSLMGVSKPRKEKKPRWVKKILKKKITRRKK